MTIALAIFGIAFAAFCVWLAVRIVNRRERWAMLMAGILIAALILYPLAFGPWCWAISRSRMLDDEFGPNSLYYPILWAWFDGPDELAGVIDWYANVYSGVRIAPAELVDTGTLTIVKWQ